MRIGWAKINDKAEVEDEVLNGQFVVPYPYMNTGDVVARSHLNKELLETTEIVGFGYESDGEKVRLRSLVLSQRRDQLPSQRRDISQLRRCGRRYRLSSRRGC